MDRGAWWATVHQSFLYVVIYCLLPWVRNVFQENSCPLYWFTWDHDIKVWIRGWFALWSCPQNLTIEVYGEWKHSLKYIGPDVTLWNILAITTHNNYKHVILFSFMPLRIWTSLVAQTVKCLSTMRETWVRALGWEDPLEKEMAIHSSTIAWKIPWTEEPDRLQSMGSQRVGHDWATPLSIYHYTHLGIKWNFNYLVTEREIQGSSL